MHLVGHDDVKKLAKLVFSVYFQGYRLSLDHLINEWKYLYEDLLSIYHPQFYKVEIFIKLFKIIGVFR